MKLPKVTLAIGTLAASAALVACGGGGGGDNVEDVDANSFPDGSRMAALADAGKIKVGVQTTYPLIGQQTLDGYSGFDIEVAKGIAAQLGISEDGVEFVPVTTPTREAFLQQDKVDIVVAAYTINDEREKVVDFAGPYYEAPSALMVPSGNPDGIEALDDMEGKKLCVAAGSVQEAAIRELNPRVAKSLVFFDSSAKCRDSVLNGSVEASSTEAAILASFVFESDDKLEVVGQEDPYYVGYYGIGVKQEDDPIFCEWVNEALATMQEEGTWTEAFDSTLGTVLGDAPTPPEIGTCGNTLGS